MSSGERWIGLGTVVMMAALWILAFGRIICAPNSSGTAFGGDAYVIYYDMSYHVCHGEGLHFSGMSYPDGEVIFMTDMLGSVTLVLQQINKFIPICDHVVGILHVLLFISGLWASWLLFCIGHRLRWPAWISAIVALSILWIHPQMRSANGHFAHGLLFYYPLIIYYWIQRKRGKYFTLASIGMLVMMVFMGLNNGYSAALGCGLMISLGSLGYLIDRKDDERRVQHVSTALIGLVALIITYIVLHASDPFEDRLRVQWGMMDNILHIKQWLWPEGSLLSYLVPESWSDLRRGYSFSLGVLGVGIYLSLRILAGAAIKKYRLRDPILIIFPIITILFLAYALGIYKGLGSDAVLWIEETFYPLTHVKAVFRFTWISIYLIILAAVHYSVHHRSRYSSVLTGLVLIPLILEAGLAWHGVADRKRHGNPLRGMNYPQLMERLDSLEIDTSHYQAIYAIPAVDWWHDNMAIRKTWRASFEMMRISKGTGLSSIGAMLSRRPNGAIMASQQMSAHPWIERSLVDRLDDQPLLLIVDHLEKKDAGDYYMMGLADTLWYSNDWSLLRLDPALIPQARDTMLAHIAPYYRADSLPPATDTAIYYARSWDDLDSHKSYAGGGALQVDRTEGQDIASIDVLSIRDREIEISLYTDLQVDHYGIMHLLIKYLDTEGQPLNALSVSSKDYLDYDRGWLRIHKLSTVPTEAARMILSVYCPARAVDIDELQIRYAELEGWDMRGHDPEWMSVNNYFFPKAEL